MSVDRWLAAAVRDVRARGLDGAVPVLEAFARAMTDLRAADWASGPIRPEHLPAQVPVRRPSQTVASAPAGPHFAIPDGSPTLRDIEMKYIQVVLEKHNGNKPAASKELGISLKTLYNKINQLQASS